MRTSAASHSARSARFGLLAIAMATALLVATGLAGSAHATPLSAFSDHSGEVHSYEDHRNAYLEGIVLDGTDLTGSVFRNATLVNAIMTSANLTNVDLRNGDLTGADLTSANLTGVDALNADFSSALLDGVSFATGDIRNAIFVGASLLGADMSSLRNANRAVFTGATYDAATLLAPGTDTSGMNFVPEPSSALLLLFGLLGLESYGRRIGRRA